MDDILGAEKHHSLGFKQHPLEEAGIIYFVYIFFNVDMSNIRELVP